MGHIMRDETKQRLTSRDIWTRALYMVLFVFAYGVARFILTFLVVFQFFAILFTGHANEPLLRLGNNLSAYVYQILQFQTFNSEDHPFPFSSWPDDEPGGERWLGDASIEEPDSDDVVVAEPESDASDAPSDDDPVVEPDSESPKKD